MSGMFDTKTDKAKRKQELTLKEQKSRRKRTIITVCVTVVFVLAAGAAMLLNSNWLRRTVPVYTIDGTNFTTAEFEYFFNQDYLNLANDMSQSGWDWMLPDQDRPLSRQIYNEETGETWADFITSRVLESLKDLVAINNAAQAEGFTLPAERYEEFESILARNEMEAAMYGFPNVDNYLQRLYGTSITQQIYLEMLEFIYTAEEFVDYKRSSFSYTGGEIDAFYAENADDYDIFRYRVFTVNADMPAPDDENYDTLREGALQASREMAETYAAGIENEDDYLAAAREYNDILYENSDSSLRELQGSNLNNIDSNEYIYAPWLRDSGRQAGDITTLDTPNGTSVLYFIERDDNNYHTVGMRQLLIMRENISPDDFEGGIDDPEYTAEVMRAADEARDRADAADAQFTDAGRTEDALIALMEEFSDDTTEGGEYEDITRFTYQGADFYAMRVVPELEAWLFEPGRAVGDSQLIETEAYGYHLLYFTGYGDIFQQMIAEDVMRTDAAIDWLDNLSRGEPVQTGWFILVTI